MRKAVLAFVVLAISSVVAGEADARKICGDQLCETIPGGVDAWLENRFEDRTENRPGIIGSTEPDLHGHGEDVTIFEKLDDNVWRYFAEGYHSLVIVSDEGVMVTDPANDERAAMLKDVILSVTNVPVKWVVLTHEHYDHSGGTSAFEEAQIVCQQVCARLFALDPFGTTPETVDIEFDEYLVIDVGDTRVDLHHFAPADGLATTVIRLPDQGIVATADLYMPRELVRGPWLDDAHMTGKHAIFSEISKWEITHAVNAHSVSTDPRDLLENIEFVSDLYDAVLAVMIRASSGDRASFVQAGIDLPSTLRLPEYSDWKGYDQYMSKHVERMVYSMGWSTCGVPGCGPNSGK